MCNNLTEIYFSKPVNFENNTYGFYLCNNLKKIILSEQQEIIPYNFLTGCPSIKNIIIPASVNKLCLYAFVQTGLINITFNGAPPTIINIDNSEYNGSDPIFADNLSLKNIYYYYQYKNEWTNNLFWIPIHVKLRMISNSNILMIRKNNYTKFIFGYQGKIIILYKKNNNNTNINTNNYIIDNKTKISIIDASYFNIILKYIIY